MEPVKVIARYLDCTLVKGLTQNFHANKASFHIHPVGGAKGKGKEIFIKELKAVFFVRDFCGNPMYEERKCYLDDQNHQGRKVEIVFQDGEVIVGSTLGYDPTRQGFFLCPADPNGNNIRVFAVAAAVKSMRFLDENSVENGFVVKRRPVEVEVNPMISEP